MKILVSGTLAYDRIMNFPGYFKDNILPDKIHILNVSFFIKELKESFGGTAGNIAYTLTLLGEKPIVLANAGRDFLQYRKWLSKHTIDQSQIHIDKSETTASAYIITDQDDNQITGFYPGAARKFYRLKKKILVKPCLAILAPDNIENFFLLSKEYKAKKIPYIFDPGQQLATLTGAQLKKVIIGAKAFISNDYELSLTLKKTGWSLSQLRSKAEIIVSTLGGKGSVVYYRNEKIKITSAKPKNTNDPTGAGDAYRAGFIKGLVLGYPLEKCGRLASVAAVYTVEKYGTQTHTFIWQSLARRYYQNYKEKL